MTHLCLVLLSDLLVNQRNLYIIFADAALISLTSVSILGRWVLLALRAKAAYKPFLVFCHFSLCYAVTMHSAGTFSTIDEGGWRCLLIWAPPHNTVRDSGE